MGGLECNEINLSVLGSKNEVFRCDAEYFNKAALSVVTAIEKIPNIVIGEAFNVSKLAGFEFTEYFTPKNMLSKDCYIVVTSKNIQRNQLDLCDYMTIDKTVADKYLRRSKLKIDDVVFSYTGEYRRALTLFKSDLQLGPNVCRMRPVSKKINSKYLSVFLNSRIGQIILEREKTLSAQPTVAMSRIRKIHVPIFITLQEKIEEVVIRCENMLENSRESYNQAESILLKELGIKGFSTTEENVAVKNLSQSFGETGRLDAEYYRPKYEFYEAKIKNYYGGYNKLGDICKYIFAGEYADAYLRRSKNLQFYIRGTNMKNGRVEKDDNYYVHPEFFTKKVCSGDIVTARVGTVGTFAEIDDHLDGAVYSDNIICFRMPDACKADVYTLLFNSKPMYELIDRLARGSVQQMLNQETLRQIIVPMLDLDLQQKISEIIQSSFELRNKSRALLDCAAKAVEIAVEHNEEKATAWLDEKVKEVERL